jgi:hypothetical protein
VVLAAGEERGERGHSLGRTTGNQSEEREGGEGGEENEEGTVASVLHVVECIAATLMAP